MVFSTLKFIRLEPRETLCDVAGGKAPVGAESVAVATAAAAVCSSLEPPMGLMGPWLSITGTPGTPKMDGKSHGSQVITRHTASTAPIRTLSLLTSTYPTSLVK